MPDIPNNLKDLNYREVTIKNLDLIAFCCRESQNVKRDFPDITEFFLSGISNTTMKKAILCRMADAFESQQNFDTINWFKSEVRNYYPDLINEVLSSSWIALFHKYLEELLREEKAEVGREVDREMQGIASYLEGLNYSSSLEDL